MGDSGQIDKDERTNALGLFNYARSYWRSGEALMNVKLKATHPHAPMSFLFYHAIELYLKAYLRACGKSVNDLKGIGHSILKLETVAEKEGLQVPNDDREVLRIMDGDDNITRSRYIVTGAMTASSEDTLWRTCKSLDELVGSELRKRNIPVRVETPIVAPVEEDDELAGIEYDLDYLSNKEREIISYLLQHNQRMFTAAVDGGHASTLISRGIVTKALRHSQVFDAEDCPMEVPRPVWALLQKHREKFPYELHEDDPHPWRVDWRERL